MLKKIRLVGLFPDFDSNKITQNSQHKIYKPDVPLRPFVSLSDPPSTLSKTGVSLLGHHWLVTQNVCA